MDLTANHVQGMHMPFHNLDEIQAIVVQGTCDIQH